MLVATCHVVSKEFPLTSWPTVTLWDISTGEVQAKLDYGTALNWVRWSISYLINSKLQEPKDVAFVPYNRNIVVVEAQSPRTLDVWDWFQNLKVVSTPLEETDLWAISSNDTDTGIIYLFREDNTKRFSFRLGVKINPSTSDLLADSSLDEFEPPDKWSSRDSRVAFSPNGGACAVAFPGGLLRWCNEGRVSPLTFDIPHTFTQYKRRAFEDYDAKQMACVERSVGTVWRSSTSHKRPVVATFVTFFDDGQAKGNVWEWPGIRKCTLSSKSLLIKMSIQSEVTPSLRTATSISITISLSAFRFEIRLIW